MRDIPVKPIIALLLVLAVGMALAACTPTPPTPEPTPTLDPATPEGRGQALFSGIARCSACHALEPDTVIVGPSLHGIATIAATRVEGLSAQEYLEESILLPDSFKPPGFETQQMDTTLAKTLTLEQMNDIVAFLLTLE